jgi:hypothetical protein
MGGKSYSPAAALSLGCLEVTAVLLNLSPCGGPNYIPIRRLANLEFAEEQPQILRLRPGKPGLRSG